METFIYVRKISLYLTMLFACFILSLQPASAKSNRFFNNIYLSNIFPVKILNYKIQEEKLKSEPDTVPNKVFTVVEHPPEFPGGSAALQKFLDENVKYPQGVKHKKGKVSVSFIITDQGNVSNAEVMKGLGPGYDEEALRVISSLPKWKPGLQSGIPVNVKYNLAVNFNKK